MSQLCAACLLVRISYGRPGDRLQLKSPLFRVLMHKYINRLVNTTLINVILNKYLYISFYMNYYTYIIYKNYIIGKKCILNILNCT